MREPRDPRETCRAARAEERPSARLASSRSGVRGALSRGRVRPGFDCACPPQGGLSLADPPDASSRQEPLSAQKATLGDQDSMGAIPVMSLEAERYDATVSSLMSHRDSRRSYAHLPPRLLLVWPASRTRGAVVPESLLRLGRLAAEATTLRRNRRRCSM